MNVYLGSEFRDALPILIGQAVPQYLVTNSHPCWTHGSDMPIWISNRWSPFSTETKTAAFGIISRSRSTNLVEHSSGT